MCFKPVICVFSCLKQTDKSKEKKSDLGCEMTSLERVNLLQETIL